MDVDPNNYEVVSFNNCITHVKERMQGHLIGEHIVVAYSSKAEHKRAGFRYRDDSPLKWKVFCLHSGKPLIKSRFIVWEDAMRFAIWANDLYGEHFMILKEYPELNIFNIMMHSIDNGGTIFKATELINKKDQITWKDWQNALKTARQYA